MSRRRVISWAFPVVLVAGLVSSVGVVASPALAAPLPPRQNESSVPSRALSSPVMLADEGDAGAPLASPVWPLAAQASIALSSIDLGALSAVVPAGKSSSSAVVSVGPALLGALGPVQGSAMVSSPVKSVGPASVNVRVLPQGQVAAFGGRGLGVVVNRSDVSTALGPVQVRIDYSGFAQAFGGDFGGRLRLVEFPACALTAPGTEGCDVPTYVDAVNDERSRTITGTVDANPDPVASGISSGQMVDGVARSGLVITLLASASSEAGDYRASDLHPTGSWDVGIGSGDFTYSVPVTLPAPATGSAPSLAMEYDSQSLDGLTSATNNQAGPVGLGWSLNDAYVERRYRLCSADGESSSEGDLCWYSPGGTSDPSNADYVITLNGVSSELVPDETTAGHYHLVDDPGWLVVRHGSPNTSATATTSSEWWTVFTPDGSEYEMGRGTDIVDGTTPTNSVLVEPVFGNDSGEPCYSNWSSTESSRKACVQGWRWMLDRVLDPNEVVTTYKYAIDSNSYRSFLGPDESREYDMGARLTEIDYGYASQIGGTYDDKVTLTYVARCLSRMGYTDPIRQTIDDCPSISSTPSDYPDVPIDEICTDPTGDTSGCTSGADSPVYFTKEMLWSIHTWVGYTSPTNVEVYQLRHREPNPPGVIGSWLWFDYLQRETKSSTGTTGPVQYLPIINFNGEDMDNIVGSSDLEFSRITDITTDLGGLISIDYGLPDPCDSGNLPDPAHNDPTGPKGGMDCYQTNWTPDGSTTQESGWFKKYVVTEVDVDPNVGTGSGHDGDPVQTTTYSYTDGGAGWRFPADPELQRATEGWTQWRGYASVVVGHGDDATAAYNATLYFIFQGLDGDRTNVANTTLQQQRPQRYVCVLYLSRRGAG